MSAPYELALALVQELGDELGVSVASALSKACIHAARVMPGDANRLSETMSWTGGAPLVPSGRLVDVENRAEVGQLEFLMQLDCSEIPSPVVVESEFPQAGVLSFWLRPGPVPLSLTTSDFDLVQVYYWPELRDLEEVTSLASSNPRRPLAMSQVDTYPHVADRELERVLLSLGVDANAASRRAVQLAGVLDNLLDDPADDGVRGHVLGGYAYGYNGSLSLCCQDLAERGCLRHYERMSDHELFSAHEAALTHAWAPVAQLDPQLVSPAWEESERILVMAHRGGWERARYAESCLMLSQ